MARGHRIEASSSLSQEWLEGQVGGELWNRGYQGRPARKTCLFSGQLETPAEQEQNERQVGRKGACLTRKEVHETSEKSGPHLLEEWGN